MEPVVRTNIDLDDEVMAELMRPTGLKTKRAAVKDALRLMLNMEREKDIRELWGIWADKPELARRALDEGESEPDERRDAME